LVAARPKPLDGLYLTQKFVGSCNGPLGAQAGLAGFILMSLRDKAA
jgi:hypothetical protein